MSFNRCSLWPAWFLYHGYSMLDTGWLCSCTSQTGFSGQIQPFFRDTLWVMWELWDLWDLWRLWHLWHVSKRTVISVICVRCEKGCNKHIKSFCWVSLCFLLIKCALREPCADPARDRVERCHNYHTTLDALHSLHEINSCRITFNQKLWLDWLKNYSELKGNVTKSAFCLHVVFAICGSLTLMWGFWFAKHFCCKYVTS